MKRLWDRWVRFLFEMESPDTLAVLRISFGFALFLNVAQQITLGDPVLMYAEIEHGGVFAFKYNNSPYTLFRFVPMTAGWVWTLVLAQLLASITLMLGLFTRVSCFAALVLQMTLMDRMVMYRYDGDNVYRVICYLLLLTPCGASWSVDAWRGKGKAQVPAWGRRLLIAQVAIIYCRTGLVKLGSSWSILDGWTAVYLALNLPGISRWAGDWAAHPLVFFITQVGTFFSSWWEILFFLTPLNMFLRRKPWDSYRRRIWRLLARFDLRPWLLSVGVMMHGSLLLLTDVGLFSVVMVSLYPAFLLPDEAGRVLQWARNRLRPGAAKTVHNPSPISGL